MSKRKARHGLDNRCLVREVAQLKARLVQALARIVEFERLMPLMRSGGFIPSVDHQTPPHVTLEQCQLYRRLLDEYTTAAAQ